jgi:hypothetical protein
MKWIGGVSAAVLLLWSGLAQAGPFGPIDVLVPGDAEHHYFGGVGAYHKARVLRGRPGKTDATHNELTGTLGYSGYDWSVAARLGAVSVEDAPREWGESRTEGTKPLIGIVAKGLMVTDQEGDAGLGATFQANRYLTDFYQNYMDAELAVTAQKRWGGRGTVYGGPFVTLSSTRRQDAQVDAFGRNPVHHMKGTPLAGLCAGFHLALPRSVFLEFEAQFTGLNPNGFSAGADAWSGGASLRFPLW